MPARSALAQGLLQSSQAPIGGLDAIRDVLRGVEAREQFRLEFELGRQRDEIQFQRSIEMEQLKQQFSREMLQQRQEFSQTGQLSPRAQSFLEDQYKRRTGIGIEGVVQRNLPPPPHLRNELSQINRQLFEIENDPNLNEDERMIASVDLQGRRDDLERQVSSFYQTDPHAVAIREMAEAELDWVRETASEVFPISESAAQSFSESWYSPNRSDSEREKARLLILEGLERRGRESAKETIRTAQTEPFIASTPWEELPMNIQHQKIMEAQQNLVERNRARADAVRSEMLDTEARLAMERDANRREELATSLVELRSRLAQLTTPDGFPSNPEASEIRDTAREQHQRLRVMLGLAPDPAVFAMENVEARRRAEGGVRPTTGVPADAGPLARIERGATERAAPVEPSAGRPRQSQIASHLIDEIQKPRTRVMTTPTTPFGPVRVRTTDDQVARRLAPQLLPVPDDPDENVAREAAMEELYLLALENGRDPSGFQLAVQALVDGVDSMPPIDFRRSFLLLVMEQLNGGN